MSNDVTDPVSSVATAAAHPEAEGFDASGMRVLIVDDNEQNVELLQAYLESLPVEVATCYDGLSAIERIDDAGQPQPDLVLLDVMMPRMSGFEVCQRIKGKPETAGIPVMMVTALNELGDIERGVESGTDEFVTKPVNKLELVTRVKALLRGRRLDLEGGDKDQQIRDLERMLAEAKRGHGGG